jgi:iron-sulfur cluster assembly protein
MISITDKAGEKILQSISEGSKQVDGLRIRVVGGGCSGLQYKLDLDVEKKGDKVFEHGGARVYVDRKSYLYINGTTVDWREGLQATGFQLDNPNVKRTCGCGESFVV